MRITRRAAAVGLAGVLGLTGAAVIASPVAASEDDADEVATTLEESVPWRGGHGRGGAHRGLEAAADALGMTEDGLRDALQVEGTTLVDVATEQGVETEALVDALVAAATERIQERVADGRLTQAEADERIAELAERVTARIAEEHPVLDGRGGGPRWGDGAQEGRGWSEGGRGGHGWGPGGRGAGANG